MLLQTWFQNKRSRVLRQLRREQAPRELTEDTPDVAGSTKRDNIDTTSQQSRNRKRLRIVTNSLTPFESHCGTVLSRKQHQKLLQPPHGYFPLPVSPFFTLPQIQLPVPISPGYPSSTVAAESSWTDYFVYPSPPMVCRQQCHRHTAVEPMWPSSPTLFSHLMLCLPFSGAETFSSTNNVTSSTARNDPLSRRSYFGGDESGYAVL